MELEDLVARFAGVRVTVIGDLMLDCYVWGTATRLSREAPVPVLRVSKRSRRPGGAANTAVNIAALGARVLLAGVVGDDPDGRSLVDELHGHGVDVGAVVTIPNRPTTTKTRLYARGQQLLRSDIETEEPVSAEVAEELLACVQQGCRTTDVLVLSDYMKGVLRKDLVHHIIEYGHAAGMPVLVDPKGRTFGNYRGATLVTPNVVELSQVTNTELETEDEIVVAARQAIQQLGGRTAVLVTRGAEGMTLVESQGVHHIPARAREVYDVTGAGDTVLAVLALGLVTGMTLPEAAALANCAASVAVTRLGASCVSPQELITCVKQAPGRLDV